MVEEVSRKIEDIAAEVSSHTGSEVAFNVYAQRHPGGIAFSHPLADNTRRIMNSLNIKQRITPSTSELSAFIDRGIPALTVGITNGENMNMPDETIEINPIFKGLAQLVGIILAIDRGFGSGN
jgi:di/tripeptidase